MIEPYIIWVVVSIKMIYVVLLLKNGDRIDYAVDVGREILYTQQQADFARKAAGEKYPSAKILGLY